MSTTLFRTLLDYAIFALSVLLIFLVAFESYLVLPGLMRWMGHFHPLVLHLPIALVFVTVVQYWRNDPQIHWYVSITALLCLVTSITGTFLSIESAAEGVLINRHQWFGVIVTFLMVVWHYRVAQLKGQVLKIFHPLLIVGILATGHLGGSVTHGEDFLAWSTDDNSLEEALPDNPQVFAHFVQPILEQKCVSCHNPNKAKGELLLTDYASLVEGGEGGSALSVEAGILHHIRLSLEEEDHMPPKNEEQLTGDELALLSFWLEAGAAESMTYQEVNPESPVYAQMTARIEQSKRNQWADLASISDGEIADLNGDYCTVLRKYHNSNALQVLIFPHPEYAGRELEELASVANNVVELSVGSLPLTLADMERIGNFSNLELLDMHEAEFPMEGLSELTRLTKLKTLKVYRTPLGDNELQTLESLSSLNELYAYQTSISDEGVASMEAAAPQLAIFRTAPEVSDFKSVLTVPKLDPDRQFFREPFYVKIDYPLKDIDIRYTLDGSNPDENSLAMRDSLLIDRDLEMRFYAASEGWEPSPLDSIIFMRSDVLPVTSTLVHDPAVRYEGTPDELFDLVKGSPNFSDGPWIAYINDPFILKCDLDEATVLDEIVLSTLTNPGSYIFPPERIRIYGGTSEDNLRLINQMAPAKLEDSTSPRLDYYRLAMNDASVKYLRIEIIPIRRLPSWHPAKGEPGWFFIDEVVMKKS